MAPPLVFPAPSEAGIITVVTDASRAEQDDGLGGLAVVSGSTSQVFILSQTWPERIKGALDAASMKREARIRQDDSGQSIRRLSMPAAETMAAIALAEAVAAYSGIGVKAVIAVGDCAPAATALSAMYSSAPQIRRLLADAATVSTQWLGVQVPRELNTVADLLSHPSKLEEVRRSLTVRGLEVVDLGVSPRLWEAAWEAASLPLATDERSTDGGEVHPSYRTHSPPPPPS